MDWHVVGDMRVNGTESVDGWCWMPSRPAEQVAVEILVDDAVVARGEARLPRPDLALPGMTDTERGFSLDLPAGVIGGAADCLVSARATQGGVVFGRRLLTASGDGWEPSHAALRAGIGAASERLARLPPRAPDRGGRWRAALGRLGDVLAAGPGAAAIGTLPRPALRLPQAAWPRVSLLLPAAASAETTLDWLRALLPAAAATTAEVIVLDDGADPATALLPRRVAGLRLAGSWEEAAGVARGEWLLLLQPHPPSSAGLAALLSALCASRVPAAVARARGGSGPALHLPLASGVRAAVRRDTLRAGETLAACMLRQAGRVAAIVAPAA